MVRARSRAISSSAGGIMTKHASYLGVSSDRNAAANVCRREGAGGVATSERLIDAGTIRKLWIGEAPLYCAHLLRLDAESRRNRFNGTVSDTYIRCYAEPSTLADAVIHGFFLDGVLRAVAELRPLPADEAEVALSIEKDWQGHGVGAVLLERALLAARNRGIKSLYMTCLPENLRMRRLARKFHANLTFGFGSVVGRFKAA
jgi:GNAT superfamily N-acetyltransferase